MLSIDFDTCSICSDTLPHSLRYLELYANLLREAEKRLRIILTDPAGAIFPVGSNLASF